MPDPDETCYEFYDLDEFLVLCDDSMSDRVRAALLTNIGHHITVAKRKGLEELPNFPEKYVESGVPMFADRVLAHYRSFDMSKLWHSPLTMENWASGEKNCVVPEQ